MSIEKLRKRLSTHSKIVLDIFVIGLWATAIVMFSMMILGILKIGQGIIIEFDFFTSHTPTKNEGILKILHGLELIFVSPLFYLLLLSLTKYISATKPEITSEPLTIKKAYMNHSMLEIMNVKILSVSLFISVLILHSIGLILENQMSNNSIIYIVLMLILLISYYFVLDKLAEKLKKE